MITLQYFNGKEWVFAGEFHNEMIAWISLGGDNLNYRTIDEDGKVITDLGEMINVWIQHHGTLDLDTPEEEIVEFWYKTKIK